MTREGLTQVNALLPAGIEPGPGEIALLFAEAESAPVPLELVPGS